IGHGILSRHYRIGAQSVAAYLQGGSVAPLLLCRLFVVEARLYTASSSSSSAAAVYAADCQG
uniref:hypothetical protein n=1 Tax=Alcaligenes nematophilus TaxID=2994643 RepID=UPI00384AD5A3